MLSSSGGGDDGSDAAKKPAEDKWDEGEAVAAAAAPAAAEEVEARSRRSNCGGTEDALLSSIQVNLPPRRRRMKLQRRPTATCSARTGSAPPSGTERDLTYLTRRRSQGSIVAPEEYDFRCTSMIGKDRTSCWRAQIGTGAATARAATKAGFHSATRDQVHAGNLAFLSEHVTEGGMIAKRHQPRLCADASGAARKQSKGRGRWADS